MQYRSLLKNGTLLVAASLLTLAACRRDKATDTTSTTPTLSTADDNGGYASDAAKLENTSNDVISITDVAATTGGSGLRTTSPCATVTNDTISTPHVLTINFGATDCLCADGKYRKGEIIVTYSGRYKDSGSVHTISYDGYYVNDNYVGGSKTVTNEGTNASGQVWYTVVVNDSIILTTDSVITQTAHRTRTWLTGYSTPTRSDDSYAIADVSGYSTVLRRANGHIFNLSITSPLTIALSCDYIEAGTLDISSSTFVAGDRILNYSYGLGATTGLCDDLAQLTIGTHTYVITLHP